MSSVQVLLSRLDPEVPLPAYARPGDAGADLVTTSDIVLKPGERGVVGTGVAIALPPGYAGFVQPRSGLALTHGVTCLNTPGLIDAGYRDEIRVLLVNTDPGTAYRVSRGDRIAQLVIQRVEAAGFRLVEELPASQRGTGGFGHSGR